MAPRRWLIDPSHSSIEFATKHMMFTTVRGRFNVFSGMLHLDRDAPDTSSVEVNIQADSVDTGAPDRDGHLKGADFFNAADHPAILFTSTSVSGAKPEAGNRFKVVGVLAMAGTKQDVVLDAEFQGRATNPYGKEIVGFAASGEVDRRDWGLKWNQALETGGLLVANKVRIEVEVQAVLQD